MVLCSDTKTELRNLQALSSQGRTPNPVMTIYPGDLCGRGATLRHHSGMGLNSS